jgi:hypothetical protein
MVCLQRAIDGKIGLVVLGQLMFIDVGRVMDTIPEESGPYYVISIFHLYPMPHKTTRITHQHSQIICKLNPQVGQFHDSMSVVPNVILMFGGLAVTHD